jgi:nicotinamidase-related amidase
MDETSRYEELKWKAAPLYTIEPPPLENSSRVSCSISSSVSMTSMTSSTSSFSLDLEEESSPPALSTEFPRTSSSSSASSSEYPHIPIHAETTALLIVDVQPEYWSNCPAVRQDFPEFPEALQSTIRTARERHAKIIWVRADYRYSHSPWLRQFDRIHKGRITPEVPCDPTSTNVKWEDFAVPQGGEAIIAKTSWSSTSNTALMDVLRCAGIDTVLVCGLITSVCVQHSAFGIFEAGFRTLLVKDACADRGRARHDAALALYGDYMYELVTSHSLSDVEKGLVPAQPVWLTMDNSSSNSRNMVMIRAFSFPKQMNKAEHEEEMARAEIISSGSSQQLDQLSVMKAYERETGPVTVANRVGIVSGVGRWIDDR